MRLAIVDDHQLFSEGLLRILEEDSGAQIMTFSNPERFLQDFNSSTGYDLIICDLEMPNYSGLKLIGEVREQNPDQKILVVSMHFNRLMDNTLKGLEVNGFLPKNSSGSTIKDAVAEIITHGEYRNSSIIPEDSSDSGMVKLLSKREIEVIQMLTEGMTSKEVAAKMHISEHTIHTHRKNILNKLNLKNTNMLIKWALEHKLVS